VPAAVVRQQGHDARSRGQESGTAQVGRGKPQVSINSPPIAGPAEAPRYTPTCSTPRAKQRYSAGVVVATKAYAAAIVPVPAPCRMRKASNCCGLTTKAMMPNSKEPLEMALCSISLCPKRSARTPQSGAVKLMATASSA